MAKLHIYRSMYNWLDRDKSVDALYSHIRNEHLSNHRVHEISGVASQTLKNWFDGKTRKPQNMTLLAVSSALGLVRADYFDRSGNVQVDFKKARELDYEKEIEKQADFLLKHGTTKQKAAVKKKRTKKNGHA